MARLLPQLLTESAARVPARAAIRSAGRDITYAELDALTNQLARALADAGVHRGDRVGIYVPKSAATVIAAFAVMKAGGVYVPLDTAAPARRCAYTLRDCDVRVLLASPGATGLSELLAEPTPLETVVWTDEDAPMPHLHGVQVVSNGRVRARDDGPVAHPGTLESDLAYILYTSGSTGEPKGVMISHRASLTFVDWASQYLTLTPDDRVTSHAPLHFDLSIFDIYATIGAGATVVPVPDGISVFPAQLADLLQDERITVTYLVPSALSLMLTYGGLAAHDLSALRAVLFAGEVFPIRSLRQLAAAVPHAALVNLYGPTETNVCTCHLVGPTDLLPDRIEPVAIGRACENTEVFAVDDQHRLVTEPGREGELWIRGPGVAHGYWGDPVSTASRFVLNPFQPHFREMAYRTGDVVSLAPDGQTWLFLGRTDHMVKSRGYRIELGDIEAALSSSEEVAEAAVVPIPDDLIGNRISAYVVTVPGSRVTAGDLEEHCRRIVPRYMIPDSIEIVSHLPRTSTGKLDRPALART